MKNIIIGIIIGMLGSVTAFAGIQYAQIPETIQGYKAVELLNYVATLKAKDDHANDLANNLANYEAIHIKPVCNLKGTPTQQSINCLNDLKKYNKDEKDFINNNK